MKKLKAHTRFQPLVKTSDFGVNLVKKACLGSSIIQSRLTPKLVTRIYAAEKKRLSLLERVGIDGSTIGRGQVGQDAYEDVKSARFFQSTLETCLAHVYLSKMLQNAPRRPPMIEVDFRAYKILIPKRYSAILSYPPAEDFVVAVYLAILITNATRSGRSAMDTTRFSVARYHGMYTMVRAAQIAVKDDINWPPVEAELLQQGHKDEVAYIHEVIQ